MNAFDILTRSVSELVPGMTIGNCHICKKSIKGGVEKEDSRMVRDENGEDAPVHGDCYFDSLSEVVEKYPPHGP